MIRRQTNPLLANLLDRVSQPQQLFSPIRVFDNSNRLLSLHSFQELRLNSKPYFIGNFHQSRGLSKSARERPDHKSTSQKGSLPGKGESLLSSPPTSQLLTRPLSLLSSQNWYTEPPAPATESNHPTVDTSKSGAATMDQNPGYQGFSEGWSNGLDPSAPSFDLNSAEGQAYQQPPAQSDSVPRYRHPNAQPSPDSSPINSQRSHNKKKNKRNRKGQSEGGGTGGEYLTPRQRRKAAREADPNQPPVGGGGGPNQLPNSNLPPKPPPGLSRDMDRAPLPAQSTLPDLLPFAPSAESGGVPVPTEAYLARANIPPAPSPSPHSLLLVIDLNGTLLHRPHSRRSDHYIRRPHAEKFVTYCIDTFSVVIWSSARPENVEKMCRDLLTDDQKQRVLAMWGRDKFGLTAKDYNRKVQVYKRLETVWGDQHINPSGMWHQGNTVLIDDSKEKARSEPHNAVTLPEFTGNKEGRWEGQVLPAVHNYLNELAKTEDVSRLMRVHPFRMSMNWEEKPMNGEDEF
ncbi:hypothetical protein QC764_212190 [Podospora pseudoanserina]|uniref:Mitochondrial import inner membrane translocase subunit TIM50 n=1 Tax=Podospora pseudoanserina TaxID=2609844 RepID=A0ABR0IJK5_9PEZI|nr:hypothetical protein QC764_212190 [Podospora pseudoanserina]